MRTDTIARTTFPLFFRRYHHLSGLSGTLREVAGELARDYGLRLFTVPLRTPSRRRILPPRVFQTRADLFEAALARALSLVREHGRPVLLTTDSITDTGWFAGRLEASGVVHAILNAATADEEARIVSEAAQAPCVTVATQMAGRGTDVSLSDAVRQAGGLHVLNLQHNRSRRVDRQIAGRAARRGDPGSCEHWQCLEVGLGRAAVAGQDRQPDRRSSLVGGRLRVGRWFGGPWMITMAQRLSEREDASLRRALGRTERRLADGLLFAPKSD